MFFSNSSFYLQVQLSLSCLMIVFFWRNSVLLVSPPAFDKIYQDGVELECVLVFVLLELTVRTFVIFHILQKCCFQKADNTFMQAVPSRVHPEYEKIFFISPSKPTYVSRNNNIRCCTQLHVMMIIVGILGHCGMTWEIFLLIKKEHGVS